MPRAGNRSQRTSRPRPRPSAVAHPIGPRPADDPRYRILITSNAPWTATGYGVQTAQFAVRARSDGHQIAIAANYGLEGCNSEWAGFPVFPRGFDQYSNDVIPAQMHEWWTTCSDETLKPLLMTLYDCWVYKGPQWSDWPIASWVPIDHAPCPPDVLNWCKRPNVAPIAMSQFGKQMLENVGVEAVYVPHALDGQVFKPTPSLTTDTGEVVTGRQLMGVPEDAHVTMIAGANKGIYPSRKNFAGMILAWRIMAANNPDAWLYLHTERHGAMGGINMDHLLAACDVPMDRVRFVDQYAYRKPLSSEFLAACYSGADVFMHCSKGEGFGVQAIEAQACGTPIVTSDFTAMPELVGDGWVVDGQPDWDPMQQSWWIDPAIPSMVEALKQSAARGVNEVSDKAAEFGARFDADRVFVDYWRPALAQIDRMLP